MSLAAMLFNDIHLPSSTKPTMICVTIWTNIMLFDKISPVFSLVCFSPHQVSTAFSKCKPNSFKDSTSPLPAPSFLNHSESKVVSKTLSAFKHSFTLSVTILLHACQSHLLLRVDKTRLAMLKNNRLFLGVTVFPEYCSDFPQSELTAEGSYS